ncbi:MAG: glycosyltransferase [Gaiellaceae bacterium]
MTVEWMARELLDRAAAGRVRAVDRVLDIGPGIRPQGFFRPRVHLCAEPHAEYVDLLRGSLRSEAVVVLHATGQDVVRLLPDDAVNTVFLLDVIEHMEKDAGARLLAECERVADTQVVVFTPLGFVTQEYEPGEADAWGLGGAEWQTHRSGWTPEEFEVGWTILASEDYHRAGEGAGESFGAFWAIKDVEARPATTGTTVPRLAALSAAVPPAAAAESRVLAQLLDGMPSDRYRLLSSGRNDPYEVARESGLGRMWLAGIGGLPGRTFDLSPGGPAVGVAGLVPEIARRGRRVARVLREEGCEALLACSPDPLDLPAGLLAARLAKVPLYVYLFEDVAARFPGGAHRKLAGLVDRVVKSAVGVIVSNDTLADRYRLRYGVSPTVVYSPAPPPLPAARSTGDEIPIVRTITYAGELGPEQVDALLRIGAVSSSLPEPVELTVQAVQAPSEAPSPIPLVRLEGPQARERLRAVQADAEALLLAVPFGVGVRERVVAWAPYEVGEYLAAGRPIFVHAPPGTFLVSYFREHECGLVVDEGDADALSRELERFSQDAGLRRRLVENARARYDADFHPARARARFLSVFESPAA